MSMITELVNRLREAAMVMGGDSNISKLFREAADTIEQLAAKVRAENNVSQPCEDAISKTDVVELLRRGKTYAFHHPEQYKTEREADIVDTLYVNLIQAVDKLPPVNPQYTENEIQKMQDLEQAEIEKAYELGKVEVQNSEDAISRQAVLEQINCWIGSGEYRYAMSQRFLLDRIKDLPSVNPQPKTGHWIWCVGSHKCSNCEEYTCFSHKELLRYCPNCGAKMESEE